MRKSLEYLFLLVAAIEIGAEIIGNETLKFIAKPLLMITLIAYYAQGVNGRWSNKHRQMVVAFVFSWFGDVTLMFVYVNPNFFLAGLVSFLITHILYTLSFANVTNKGAVALLPKKFWVLTPLLIYMGILLSLLLPAIYSNPETKPVLIPVIVYTTAISVMVAFSINRIWRVSDLSFMLVFAGAMLFMFSDSMIAINRFLTPFTGANICIMVTYIAGQYLIAKGILAEQNTK